MKNLKVAVFGIILVFAWSFPAYASEVDNINASIKAKGGRWKAAETSMSKLSPAEQQARLGLLTAPPPPGQTTPIRAPLAPVSLPAFLDWRNNNGDYVTGVRDQSSCGSCWAFASTAGLESATLIKNNSPGLDLDLSEQVVVSCSGEGSCDGGYLVDDFFVTTGVPLESCYPYTSSNGSCSNACANWQNDAYKISSYTWVVPFGGQQTADILKNAVNAYGPVVVTMAVYTDFMFYTSGIYSHVTGFLQGYHAILLIGYDDANSCFIVKNSWGTGWGESGFFRIAYSEVVDAVDFGYEALAYGITPDPSQVTLYLTVNPGGSGTITANPPSPARTYKIGDTVQLTAVPLGCSDFLGWSGDASGGLNPVSIVMDSNKSVTANFLTKKVSLTTAVNDPLGGTVSGGGSYDCGSTAKVTASPSPGYLFAGWSGDASGTTNPLSVVMDRAKSVTASFTQGGLTLSSSLSGTSVTLTAAMTYKNAAVSGQSVVFYVDGRLQSTAVTGASGTAAVTFTSSPGSHSAYAVSVANGDIPAMRSDTISFNAVAITFRITVAAGPNGSITPGTMDVVQGATQVFKITPASGYAVENVTVDGVSKGVMTSWIFSNVQSVHTIAATFIPTITATAGSGGSISPSGTTRVANGGSQTYTIKPNTGYHILGVLVDGASVGPVSTYTFSSVTAPHTISASFAQNPTVIITATAGPNGSITPSGNVPVVIGTNQTFKIAPAPGYAIAGVTVDGVYKGVMVNWAFTNVQTAHTISATFSPTITATAGSGGTISPSGTTRVASGGSQTYTIKPNSGYHITGVLVDGSSVGPVTTYTFSNVTTPHTISASFAQNGTVTITATAGPNGSITPSGNVTVVIGTNQTFKIAAASGYAVGNVTVDGVSKGVMTSWTFTNVQTGHAISATFIPTITATAGSGGSISPSGTSRVTSGGSLTYTITPSAGYHVTDVAVDGSSVGALTKYTFSNVTAPHTISASFAQNPTVTINATAGPNGGITPSGNVTVVIGTNQTFKIAPASGYGVGGVTVDGVYKGVMTNWAFTNVQTAHTISATFSPTITAMAGSGGSISPSGTTRVASGGSLTYTITPSAGYHIAGVLVDGSSVGAVSKYIFSNVTAPHTISASFAAN